MANFGIDLLLESQKANIRSENDILVIFMHWVLCKNNLRNVGVGDNKIYNPEDRPSELMPEGWNYPSEDKTYTLRYSINDNIYILYSIVTDDSLLINLLDTKSLKTASLVVEAKKVVKSIKGMTLDDFIIDSEALIKRIDEDIVSPIFKKAVEEKASEPSSNPLLVRPPINPPEYDHRRPYFVEDPLRNIGRGDLDPFGVGGGMIFQPFNPLRPDRGLGPMGIPPRARFDPPNPFNRMDPNNDHFPPPGYDDMFM